MHLFTVTSIVSTFLYGILFDWRLLCLQLLIIGIYMIGHKLNDHGRTSTRRKIQMGSWGAPQDPSCYGVMEFDCEIVDEFIASYNKKHPDEKITYTHFFMKALGQSVAKSPDANGTIAFGQFVPFNGVHINTLVDIDGKNLAGVTVSNCDKISFSEMRKKTNSAVKKIKSKKDANFKEQMKIAKMLPSFMMACLLQFSSFLSYYLGIDVAAVKIKKYQFGNVVLTNASSMEVYNTFAPLVNFCNAIVVAVICKPRDKVVVGEDRQMQVKKIIQLNMTFDHRYADAMSIHPTIKELYRLVANPQDML